MSFFSALLLGLLASTHCAGMCGGLQAAMQHTQAIRSARQIQLHTLALNLGRISIYIIAGALFAWLGTRLGTGLRIQGWAEGLRVASAIVMVLIGLQLLLSKQRPLHWLEKPAYALWRQLQPLIRPSQGNRYGHSVKLGMLWAFLPCGLVYSLLLAATLSPDALDGALVMAGFGLGTLPAMMLTGTALMALRRWLQNRYAQHAGGLFFMFSGVALLSAPMLINHSAIKANPLFYNLVQCFS